MGLFSSKTETYVSSQVWNLAGEAPDRINFLKTTIIGGILNTPTQIDRSIVPSYLHGSAIKLKSFDRWASKPGGYNELIALQGGIVTSTSNADISVVRDYLLSIAPPNTNIEIGPSEIGPANYGWTISKYVAENYPAMSKYSYTTSLAIGPTQPSIIKIEFSDPGHTTYTPIILPNLNSLGTYLYVDYYEVDNSKGPAITDPIVNGSPDITGLVLISDTGNVTHPVTLYTTIVTTVTDINGPVTTSSTSTVSTTYTAQTRVYSGTRFLGKNPVTENMESEEATITWHTGDEVKSETTTTSTDTFDGSGNWVSTTVVEITTETIVPVNKYEKSYKLIQLSGNKTHKVFIYQQGTGNATLDALFGTSAAIEGFLPFLPYRINNTSIADATGNIYESSVKAFKKATGVNQFNKVLDQIEDNPNIGDMDYCYSFFGIALNTRNKMCKRYIYAFFKHITTTYSMSNNTEYANWNSSWDAANASNINYVSWYDNLNDPSKWIGGANYNPNASSPPILNSYPILSNNTVQYYSTNGWLALNLTISWATINETTGTGMLDPTKKVGDLWFVVNADIVKQAQHTTNGTTQIVTNASLDNVTLCWQKKANEWSALTIVGLTHNNLVYAGKSVTISAKSALADVDESGFLIPMCIPILKEIGLVNGTQSALECHYLLFNCYTQVKIRWYQQGWFKTALMVAAIVATVYTGIDFTSVGGGSGILGTNAAIGGSIGLSGTAAVVAGASANALAAMVVSSLIIKAATSLLGDKIGAIVGTIVAAIAINGLNNADWSSEGFKVNWEDFTKADNLIKLSAATFNNLSSTINKDTLRIQKETEDFQKEYAAKSKEIQDRAYELFGSNGVIDPFILTVATQLQNESPDSFLDRTLMTGSDIADLSIKAITQFPELSLKLQQGV